MDAFLFHISTALNLMLLSVMLWKRFWKHKPIVVFLQILFILETPLFWFTEGVQYAQLWYDLTRVNILFLVVYCAGCGKDCKRLIVASAIAMVAPLLRLVDWKDVDIPARFSASNFTLAGTLCDMLATVLMIWAVCLYVKEPYAETSRYASHCP